MAELTDQEIVAACARAIGVQPHPMWNAAKWPTPDFFGTHGVFNPLTDRAQAMELVLKLPLQILDPLNGLGVWAVNCFRFVGRDTRIVAHAEDKDLLRAICLCAARVQIEKEKNANG